MPKLIKTLGFIGCIILLLSLIGCGAKEPIKIGVVGTLTGINSDLSVSGRRGVELAVDQINEKGGIDGRLIQLIAKDDLNNADVALERVHEFVDEGIKIVIGPYTSGMIVGSIDVINAEDILYIGPTISADSLSNIDDHFLRFIATTEEQAKIIAETAKNKNHKHVVVIYDMNNKGFCEMLYNNFKARLEADQGEVVKVITFDSKNTKDFNTVVEQTKGIKSDAILLIANSTNNAEITQLLRIGGNEAQIYAPLWSNTGDLIKKGGTFVEGMYVVGAIDLNNTGETFVRFKTDFLNKYGEMPTFSSKYAYEAATALFEALSNGAEDPDSVKAYIINKKQYQGLEEPFEINAYGDNIRNYMIFEIKEGQLRKVE